MTTPAPPSRPDTEDDMRQCDCPLDCGLCSCSRPDTVPAEGEMELVTELQEYVARHRVYGTQVIVKYEAKLIERARAAITRLSSALTSKDEELARLREALKEDR